MLEKLKAKLPSKGQFIGHFGATIIGLVGSGAIATFLGEQLGYSALVFYGFAMFFHGKVADLLEKKVK